MSTDDCFDRSFLLHFGLPNSPISGVDEEIVESLPTEIREREEEPKIDEKLYPTFFSQLPHK